MSVSALEVEWQRLLADLAILRAEMEPEAPKKRRRK